MNTVAFASPWIPPEWIAAHRLGPQWLPVLLGEAAAPGEMAPGVCPYCLALLEAAQSKGDAAAFVMTTTCDQMRRIAEWIARRQHRPVFLLNVPSTWQTAASKQLYAEELRRLGRFLVRLGGCAPPPDVLAEVMGQYDAARALLREAAGQLTPEQFAQALAALPQRPPLVQQLDSKTERPAGIPLALIGGPVLPRQWRCLEVLRQAGGRVVLDGTTGGQRTLPAPFDPLRLAEDPFAELARAYFEGLVDPAQRPNQRFYDWLWREVAALGVRGLLVWRYVWCDIWHGELNRLRELSAVPVLELDAATEQDDSLVQTIARIEAFLEMLQRQPEPVK